ncbi:protein kinase domain-containing protein [Intrasporangium sp.]|uniref:protein kinase domain-containing protein n=1 Tax=Intrasporangium sp. TaxID=1925024 RepID=UPI00293A97D1|nr:protein kinase [Intrasporangium sp.]MDV3221433.1 protein kinase [Intrasporangium sp.]
MLAGRYQLESRIAAGGMGEVHVAMDERLHRRVAVKLLREELAGSGDFVERFRREALMSARLTHPSVARLLDYGQDGETHFIVMELVEGQDLSKLLAQRGRFPTEEAARITAQVCDALGAAHEAGFVHRDVKPSNVIVTPEGTVKVTDFGIARALGGSSLTQTGTIMGTAQYVSPEMVRGEPASPASDLYSVGVLLFQMLTGRVPFDGDSPVTVALRHLEGEVPRPSTVVADVSFAMDEVVVRATALDPRDRFPDAATMATALRQVAAAAPAQGRPTTVLPAGASAPGQTHVLAGSAPAPNAATSVLPDAMSTIRTDGPSEPREHRAQAATTRREAAASRDRAPGHSRLTWVVATLLTALVASAVTLGLTREDDDPAPPVAPPSSSTTEVEPPPEEPTTPEGPAMPRDAVGRERADVVDELIDRGLNVRWALVRSGAPEGSVIGTFPRPGEAMERGQTAVIVVSRGQLPDGVETIEVPDGLVGAETKDATKVLREEGLRVGTAPIASPFKPGTVIGHWPAAGEPASDGVVVLVVSGGDGGDTDEGKDGDKKRPPKDDSKDD